MSTANDLILKFTAGEDLVIGDIVKFDTDGTVIKETSAEAVNAIGAVYSDADDLQPVSVMIRGVMDCHVLVEDTNSSAGYDAAITYGTKLLIAGKAAGTYGVGQAFSSDQGTGATGGFGTIKAVALGVEAGSTDADTYSTISCLVNFA